MNDKLILLAKQIEQERPPAIKIRVLIERVLNDQEFIQEQLSHITNQIRYEADREIANIQHNYMERDAIYHDLTKSCNCEACKKIYQMTYPIALA